MTTRSRLLLLILSGLLLALVAGGYVVQASHRGRTSAPTGTIDLGHPGQLLFRNAGTGPSSGMLASVPLSDLSGQRTISDLSCVRLYAAAGSGVCLTVERSAIPKIYAVVLDRSLHQVRRVSLPGAPSRARVSASGRMISWTVFTSGDSYNNPNLSTRTGIFDDRTGQLIPSLESFTLLKDGHRYTAPDLNYWGVTFAADDAHFYATARTGGKTYLVQGAMATRILRTLHDNVECPSLSPDGNRLVFKRATGDPTRPWRLYVLELASSRETALAEPQSVDDQAAWLDEHTVIYGKVDGATTDLWAVPADGGGAPRMLVRNAFSPAVLR